MILGIWISVLAVYVTAVSGFLFETSTTVHSPKRNHNSLDGDPDSRQQGFMRILPTQNQKFSSVELEKVKHMMTISRRGIQAAEVALQEYESSELYSVSEHVGGKLETKDFILSTYEQILSTTQSIICSENHALQTITNAIKIRGLVRGQEPKATEIAKQFHIAQLQIQSLQTLVSLFGDGTKTQCEIFETHPSFQQYLNFNIVKETKQIIQNLKAYIERLNQTFNDCETVETMRTFLSRAKMLLPVNAQSSTFAHGTPYIFSQSIRYSWNETEQSLCGVQSDLMAVKRSWVYRSSENQQTSDLDTVQMNIQNSLTILGSRGCTHEFQLSSSSHVPNDQDLYRSAYSKISNLLFQLFSYQHSRFCSS